MDGNRKDKDQFMIFLRSRWASCMERLLAALELLSVALAIVFGFMWMANPAGRFEPYSFMATLLGTTVVDILRRSLLARRSIEDMASAFSKFAPMLAERLERKFEDIASQLSTPNQEVLRREMTNLIPSLMREVMNDWQQSQGKGSSASSCQLAEVATRMERSLEEAYGIDQTREASPSMSLADAKPWRFKDLGS